MKPYELYKHIWSVEYVKSGFDLDWLVEVDDNEKKIRLLFQPSMSVQDWVVNLAGAFPLLRFPFFICFGWKTVFEQSKPKIFTELLKQYYTHDGYTIEITGHSYGGSMSLVAGLELYKQTRLKADVITFGAPAPLFLITSKLIAKRCLGKVEQYAHWSDLVTFCPPFLGYHNVTVKRIGKFNLKDFFNPMVAHLIYDQPEVYGDE